MSVKLSNDTLKAYESAKEIYAKIGVDTDKAIENTLSTPVSMHCWQGDDVRGFLFDLPLSGGIQTTGNYPGRARTCSELRDDISKAMSLIPSNKLRLNLHAIYADTYKKIDLNEIEPEHYASWIDFAKEKNIALDFNPTCFSHPMAASGFTISSNKKEVRDYWIEHCRRSRKISEYFGKQLGEKSVNNLWFPDGYKDTPFDREGPRRRAIESLDKILSDPVDKKYNLDSIESKVFGIGAESYTVISSEMALGYAASRNIACCLDAGHFHPTEVISDKISSVLCFTEELMLHVSRPVRWDSDHVVALDDELCAIMQNLVRTGLINRTHIGLDFFDASINRVAAWVIGTRNTLKALLKAFLEPGELLKTAEENGDYTTRLALLEEIKCYPFGAVFDYMCALSGVPIREKWLNDVRTYEKDVLFKR